MMCVAQTEVGPARPRRVEHRPSAAAVDKRGTGRSDRVAGTRRARGGVGVRPVEGEDRKDR